MKRMFMWFSVLMDRVKPGAVRKEIWATSTRLWWLRPEGRTLEGFPEVSVVSGNSAPRCRRADRDVGQKPWLGTEQAWLYLLIFWEFRYRQANWGRLVQGAVMEPQRPQQSLTVRCLSTSSLTTSALCGLLVQLLTEPWLAVLFPGAHFWFPDDLKRQFVSTY